MNIFSNVYEASVNYNHTCSYTEILTLKYDKTFGRHSINKVNRYVSIMITRYDYSYLLDRITRHCFQIVKYHVSLPEALNSLYCYVLYRSNILCDLMLYYTTM